MKKILYSILFLIAHFVVFAGATARIIVGGYSEYIFSGSLMHFIAFFGMAALTALVLMTFKIRFPLILSFLYASALAVLIELIQLKFPFRVSSLKDILFGVLGSLIFTIAAAIMLRTKIGKKIKKIVT